MRGWITIMLWALWLGGALPAGAADAWAKPLQGGPVTVASAPADPAQPAASMDACSVPVHCMPCGVGCLALSPAPVAMVVLPPSPRGATATRRPRSVAIDPPLPPPRQAFPL